MKVGVIILAGILLLSIILLNGCANSSSDMNEIIVNAENCTPTSTSHDASVELFGIAVSTTTLYEIKGSETDGCSLFMRIDDMNFHFTDAFIKQIKKSNSSITDEQIQKAEEEANNSTSLIIGKNGTCTFLDNKDLVNLLKKIKSGKSSGGTNCTLINGSEQCESTGDWAAAKCSGSVFTTSESIA